MMFDRFSNLPKQNGEYFFCMICLTTFKERYSNFTRQKKKIPDLVLYDAITPQLKGFEKECAKLDFHPILKREQGTKALWLSNIKIFEYFLKTRYKYLIILEDDSIVPENLQEILNKEYINHKDFLKFGGVRLGQYASCNLYNRYCVKKIFETINKYPIDRGIDHYISNIPTGTKEKRPYIFNKKLSELPSTITKVNPEIAKKSVRISYNKNFLSKEKIKNLLFSFSDKFLS